jgi:protein TonB
LGISSLSYSQTEESVKDTFLHKITEVSPKFPGSEEARLKFLRDNIKYPEEARKKNIQGTVYTSFVIERDGSVSDVKIFRGIGDGLDDEAVRVVKSMPKWIPGKNNGKPVRSLFMMPIKFTLR